MTEIKYLDSCDLFEVKYKSGKHSFLEEEEMISLGFDMLAIKFATCCPNMFVTIEQ